MAFTVRHSHLLCILNERKTIGGREKETEHARRRIDWNCFFFFFFFFFFSLSSTSNPSFRLEPFLSPPTTTKKTYQVYQFPVHLPAAKRGCHLITRYVSDAGGAKLRTFRAGTAHIFIKHTSAALTVNENADPDVRADMETFLNLIVPEGKGAPWVHTDEGDDDMPAHCKSSLLGSSVTLPVTDGRLALGTWQGEFFFFF